jgi:hypothetical protein
MLKVLAFVVGRTPGFSESGETGGLEGRKRGEFPTAIGAPAAEFIGGKEKGNLFMKYQLLLPLGLAVALTGCVQSHMASQAQYDTGMQPAPLAPTSSRPVVRVYQDSNGEVSPAATDDMDRAIALRNMIQNDHGLRVAVKNVDIEIKDGRAILRGSVKDEHQSNLIQSRVSSSMGIASVENRLMVQ